MPQPVSAPIWNIGVPTTRPNSPAPPSSKPAPAADTVTLSTTGSSNSAAESHPPLVSEGLQARPTPPVASPPPVLITPDVAPVATSPAPDFSAVASAPPPAPTVITQPVATAPLVVETPVAAAPPPVEDGKSWIPSDKNVLVETPTTINNLTKLSEAVTSRDHVLLTGGTGAGKTALCKYLAHLTNTPLRRANMDANTDEVALFGGYKPGPDGGFRWVDGVVTSAIRNGQWLLLDEVNLADPAVLERMNPLLDGDGYLVLTEKQDQEKVPVHPNTRIFATMNPASYAGRKELSAAMNNRFQRKIWVDSMPAEENVQVMKQSFPSIPEDVLLAMSVLHSKLSELSETRQLGKKGGPYPFTLRDLLKLGKRVESEMKLNPSASVHKVAWAMARDVYVARFMNADDRAAVEDILAGIMGKKNNPQDLARGPRTMGVEGAELRVGGVKLPYHASGGSLVPEAAKAKMPVTASNVDRLEFLARCAKYDEPVLLVGNTAAGKTSMVRWLAHETNNEFRRVNLSSGTDSSHLIGGYFPCVDPVTNKPIPGKFEWRDGIVIEAMKKGQWLVLDEINLADAAVLERLNSLLDPDRAVVLDEHNGERVVANPNFRCFATMNPVTAEYGGRKELSPAMRNRFTEVWWPGVETVEEKTEIVSMWLKDMAFQVKTDKNVLASQFVAFHEAIKNLAERHGEEAPELNTAKKDGYLAYTLRDLQSFVECVAARAGGPGADPSDPKKQITLTLQQAFVLGARSYYADGLRRPEDRKKVEELAQALAEPLR